MSLSDRHTSDDESCPICLCSLLNEFAKPENCIHRFDRTCIKEWAKLKPSCPSCRTDFRRVFTYKVTTRGQTLVATDEFSHPINPLNDYLFGDGNPHEFTMCEICHGGQSEELMLICDSCDKGFHTFCLDPPLDAVPSAEQWFCPPCETMQLSVDRVQNINGHRRLVQRTALAERVRRNIIEANAYIDRTAHQFCVAETMTEIDTAILSSTDEIDEEEEESGTDNEINEEDIMASDDRVLNQLTNHYGNNIALPSVKRRRGGEKSQSSKTRPKSKRSLKGKKGLKKKSKRRSGRKKKCDVGLNGSLDIFFTRKGTGPSDPIARLSLNGAGLEPVIDESVDSVTSVHSKRFDQPLFNNKRQIPTKLNEEQSQDTCDLLGSIITEQTKTLAPGKLFSVQDGRFTITEEFKEYQTNKEKKMTFELKERLGIIGNDSSTNSASSSEKTQNHVRVINMNVGDSSQSQCSSNIHVKEKFKALKSTVPHIDSEQYVLEMRRQAEQRRRTLEEKIFEERRIEDEKRRQEHRRLEMERKKENEKRLQEMKAKRVECNREGRAEPILKLNDDHEGGIHESCKDSCNGIQVDRNQRIRETNTSENKYQKINNSCKTSNFKKQGRRVSSGNEMNVVCNKLLSSIKHRNSCEATPKESSFEYKSKCTTRDLKEKHRRNDDNNRQQQSSSYFLTENSAQKVAPTKQQSAFTYKRSRRGTDLQNFKEETDSQAVTSATNKDLTTLILNESTSWMPKLDCTMQSTSNEYPEEKKRSADIKKEAKNSSISSSEKTRRLSVVDTFAKRAIAKYIDNKLINQIQYKEILRKVVVECYKKGILTEDDIKARIKNEVHSTRRKN